MKKNKKNQEKSEIKYLAATTEVKNISDRVLKAAYIALNYVGEVNLSINSIAKYFGINFGTLRKRIWSILCGHTDHGSNKLRYLAPVYEEELAQKIDERAKNLKSATIEEVKTMAFEIKKKVEEEALGEMKLHYKTFEREPFDEPSDSWINGFKERNELRKKASTDLESNRAKMGTIGNISEWFDKTYDNVDLNAYDKRMIGNGDETMLQTKSKLICLIKRSSVFAVVEDEELNEHITLLTMITTNGDSMPPLCVFNLKNVPSTLDDLIKAGKIIVTGQKSGWIDMESFNAW